MGSFEIACGLLVLIGLFTRLAVIPLVVIMLVALATTKLPMLAAQGFWVMAHESRTDWSMLLGSLYLRSVGAGAGSLGSSAIGRREVNGWNARSRWPASPLPIARLRAAASTR